MKQPPNFNDIPGRDKDSSASCGRAWFRSRVMIRLAEKREKELWLTTVGAGGMRRHIILYSKTLGAAAVAAQFAGPVI